MATVASTGPVNGDSLSTESAPYVTRALGADGDTVVHIGFPGTAICDWWGDLTVELTANRPDLVVALFTGNALTPCMTDRTSGSAGIVDGADAHLRRTAYEHAWLDDVTTLVSLVTGTGIPLALIASPPSRSFSHTHPHQRPYVDGLHRDAATRPLVDYIDLDNILTPNGIYTATLPCLPHQPACTTGEPVPVRAEDGGHLCDPGRSCYGAWRLATMLHNQLRPNT